MPLDSDAYGNELRVRLICQPNANQSSSSLALFGNGLQWQPYHWNTISKSRLLTMRATLLVAMILWLNVQLANDLTISSKANNFHESKSFSCEIDSVSKFIFYVNRPRFLFCHQQFQFQFRTISISIQISEMLKQVNKGETFYVNMITELRIVRSSVNKRIVAAIVKLAHPFHPHMQLYILQTITALYGLPFNDSFYSVHSSVQHWSQFFRCCGRILQNEFIRRQRNEAIKLNLFEKKKSTLSVQLQTTSNDRHTLPSIDTISA